MTNRHTNHSERHNDHHDHHHDMHRHSHHDHGEKHHILTLLSATVTTTILFSLTLGSFI